MGTAQQPGQKWGAGETMKAEQMITWGGALLPPIETLHTSVRHDYLHKFYLPKLQADSQPQEVLKRVTSAALADKGYTDTQLFEAQLKARKAPTPQISAPSPAHGSSNGRKRDSDFHPRRLHRSASEPLPGQSTQRQPGSLAVPTDSGKYGTYWLAPHSTSAQYGAGTPNQRPFHAGPDRLWGPVAKMTLAPSWLKAGSSSNGDRGSGRIRFSESCGRTPSEKSGRTTSQRR